VDNIFVTYCVMVLLTYVIICVSLLLCFLVFIFYDITVACGAKFLVYVVFAFFVSMALFGWFLIFKE